MSGPIPSVILCSRAIGKKEVLRWDVVRWAGVRNLKWPTSGAWISQFVDPQRWNDSLSRCDSSVGGGKPGCSVAPAHLSEYIAFAP